MRYVWKTVRVVPATDNDPNAWETMCQAFISKVFVGDAPLKDESVPADEHHDAIEVFGVGYAETSLRAEAICHALNRGNVY